MSAEKVSFVIRPEHGLQTPRALWEAFKKDEQREIREKRAAAILAEADEVGKGKKKRVIKVRPAREYLCSLGGDGRSKIGPSLSGNVYDLVMGA